MNGPPEKEAGPDATNAEADQVSNDTTTPTHDNRLDRHGTFDALVGNRRRFGASRRMAPIPTCVCGRCVRDPQHDRHRCGDEISDVQAEAAVAAIVALTSSAHQDCWTTGHVARCGASGIAGWPSGAPQDGRCMSDEIVIMAVPLERLHAAEVLDGRIRRMASTIHHNLATIAQLVEEAKRNQVHVALDSLRGRRIWPMRLAENTVLYLWTDAQS